MSTRRTFGSIRRLPSGRYQASHAHPETGARINAPRTFPTRKLAADWLKAQDVDLSRGTWAPPAPKTAPVLFGTYAAAWLDRRAPELKPKTVYDYTRMLAELTEHYGRRPLASITSADVRAWYNGLDPAKPTKRANMYVLLKTVLKAAVADELIPVCPANIRGASAVKRAHKVKPATPDEIGAIVAAMPPRWALMVQLAVYCGLRFGEIAELRRGDVDLAAVLHTLDDDGAPVTVPAPVVRVSRGVQWIKGRPAVSSTKTAAGVRAVAIPSGLVPAIAAHLDVYASPEPDGLLFTAARNPSAYVAHGTVSQAFQRARKAAGRPDLRFHDLRHTGASMMSETGASVRELQEWLGHSTAEMALFYTHVSPARMRRNADALPAPAAERINR